jgi:gas vesicle protein
MFRFLSPIALALGASAYCIPRTTNNVIHGLRTYDYTQWSHDMHHKFFHAKKSIIETTYGLTSAAGSVAGTVVHGAQDTAHDLSEKTHELSDKTQHLLKDVKEKGVHVAHDIQDKGESLVKEAKHMGHDLTRGVGHAKDQVEGKVEEGVEHAKHWWNSEKKTVEKSAKDFSKAARQTGEDAKDWARQTGEDAKDWAAKQQRSHSGFNRHDVERGFERFKSRAQDGSYNAREDMNDAFENGRSSRLGRDARRKFDSWKDSAEDWAQDRSREARGSFERAKNSAQDWTQDRGYESRQIGRDVENRLDDARREFKKYGREAENRFDDARDELKKHGREARDFSEDRFRDARRDIRNRAEDLQDHGRRQFHKFEREVDDRTNGRGSGGWGFGGDRNSEDYGGRRGRYEEREEYGGRGGGWKIDDTRPRRSVTEAAKEGKHWWSSSSPRHSSAADPYESYDRDTNNRSTWWKAGSGPSIEESVQDQFDQAKHQVRRGTDRFRENVDDKMHETQSWFDDTKHDLQDRFQHAKHDLRNKFAHDQGREFRGFGKGVGGHNHESIYSHDNWFHYDHGEEATAAGGARRGRGERGL